VQDDAVRSTQSAAFSVKAGGVDDVALSPIGFQQSSLPAVHLTPRASHFTLYIGWISTVSGHALLQICREIAFGL